MKKNNLLYFLLLFVMFSCHTLKNNNGFFKQKYTNLKVTKYEKNKQQLDIISNKKVSLNTINNSYKINHKKTFNDLLPTSNKILKFKTQKTKLTNTINIAVQTKIKLKQNLIVENKTVDDNTLKVKNKKVSTQKEYSLWLLVVLCFLIPFLAVGLKTNWDMVKVIIAFILWPLFFISIIFALLIIYDILEF